MMYHRLDDAPTQEERLVALRKAANANLVALREKSAGLRVKAALEKRRLDEEKVAVRAYKAAVRKDIAETKAELKELRRYVRSFERRVDRGERLTTQDQGAYEEADHRESRLWEYLDDLKEMLRSA